MVFGQITVYLNDCVINEIMIRDCSIELLFQDGLETFDYYVHELRAVASSFSELIEKINSV